MITREQVARVLARAPKPKDTPAPPRGRKVYPPEALRELLALIPNHAGIHREGEGETWVGIGHWAKGLCPEGRGVFIDWTLTWKGTPNTPDKHTEESIGHSWDGFGNSGLLSQGGRLRAMAERINPAGFKQWDARWVFDDGVEPPGARPGKSVVRFKLGAKQQILSLAENAKRGIEGQGIACSYDDFHHRTYIAEEEATDTIVLLLRDGLTREYGKEFSLSSMWEAVLTLAHGNRFNPVRDMLASAEALWDGVKRLDRLGPDYFRSEDTEFARMAFRKTMLAAARRARRPGCKFDQILVTESPEGWNKSSAWAVLAGEGNFSDASILGRDARAAQEELGDIWILEIAELSGLSKADVEHVKAFASRVNDRARPAYGRVLINQARQCVVVGTTNAEVYLISPTGNRRFWTVKLLQPIDLGGLRADRLQLWGEAAAAESADETLVLPRRLWSAAGAEQEKRRIIDPWEDELANLKGHMAVSKRDGKDFITRVGVHEFLRQRGQILTPAAGKRIAEIMRKLGWDDCRYKIDDEAVRGFEKSDSTTGDGVTEVSPKNVF